MKIIYINQFRGTISEIVEIMFNLVDIYIIPFIDCKINVFS